MGEAETKKIISGRKARQAKIREAMENMERDRIISKKVVDGNECITLTDRQLIIKIIKKYRKGFIGTLEENLLSLLDED
jgi:hypothetical protein